MLDVVTSNLVKGGANGSDCGPQIDRGQSDEAGYR